MNTTGLPTTSPLVVEGEARPVIDEAQLNTPDVLHLFTCLLVGGGIEAVDLVLAHARAWQERFAATPKLLPIPGEQNAADLVRYALIGAIFDAEDRLRHHTLWWGDQLLRSVEMAAALTRPVSNSWLMAPVQQPMRSLSLQMQSELARLIRRGRIEEALSRVMATEVTDEVVSVVLAYLANKPEVRRLIEEQSFSMADEVVDQVRHQAAAADGTVESIVRRLFRLAPRQPAPPPASVP